MKILTLEELKACIPRMKELSPEELAEAYALARAAFSAADLQAFTEEDKGTPMEELLEELEEAQRRFDEKSE